MSLSILENLKADLPPASVPEDVDVENLCAGFCKTLSSLNADRFTPDAIWRDMFALTGSSRTFYGAHNIIQTWRSLIQCALPENITYLKQSARKIDLGESNWIEGTFTFEIDEAPARKCTAALSIVPADDGTWKIWVLRTFLDKLRNYSSVDTMAPARQMNGDSKHLELRHDRKDTFECVVVGGGQAGLSVAGRLQSQGIDYVLLEKNEAVGDSWKKRYRSTKLHTNRESSHLPFNRTFPSHYPQYLGKDDLARGYSDWARHYGINVWLSTTLVSGQWHKDTGKWTLVLLKGGETRNITTTHVVLAIGAGCQIPMMPTYPGKETFRGEIQHSAEYYSADKWKGKHGVVVGTANTAHDVAEDMVAAGMVSVTMIQRSPTYVLPAEYYEKVQELSWNADVPTEIADQEMLTVPLAVSRLISMLVLHGMARAEPERFDALEKAGFKTVRYGDIIYQVFDRFGGHYMDVGASAKIAKGLIKVKSDALPVHYTPDGLRFSDGSELKADAIVFATGFVGTMKGTIRELLGSDVADRVEDFWGVNEEGDVKGAFKPCGHSNLWMHGGTTTHARYMSRYVALQIRAALDGTPLPILS
ncbi:hypothetical protein LTR41_007778 [Exophiala xenobiotica]|nr:hypothetical protein LTR41_007778 [Exophiala xenobiotica]